MSAYAPVACLECDLLHRQAKLPPGGERPMLAFETLTLSPYDRRLIVTAELTDAERRERERQLRALGYVGEDPGPASNSDLWPAFQAEDLQRSRSDPHQVRLCLWVDAKIFRHFARGIAGWVCCRVCRARRS